MQTEDAARGPTATTPPEPPRPLFAGLHIDQQTAVITGRHGQDEHGGVPKKGMSFWHTVAVVEFTDVVFAVDSILVAVALVNPAKNPDKMWIVYAGGFLGIILLRLAAGAFIALIRKFPALDNMAYALVGWAGVKLAFTSGHLYGKPVLGYEIPELPKPVFWAVFMLIVIFGAFAALRHRRNAADVEEQQQLEESLDELRDSGFVPGGARVFDRPADAPLITSAGQPSSGSER